MILSWMKSPNDEKQNYIFYRLQLSVGQLGTSNFEPTHEELI